MTDATDCPDYGGPFVYVGYGRGRRHICDKDGYPFASSDEEWTDRIIACLTACAGMADPAAEIERMRARVAELEKRLGIDHHFRDAAKMVFGG